MRHELSFELNGSDVTVSGVATGTSLLQLLRDHLGVTSPKPGCLTGDCGCCNVQLDGRVVPACLVLAPTVAGRAVRTVEGLSDNGELAPVQRCFAEHYAAQCGYCTSGQLMAAQDVLEHHDDLTYEEVQRLMAGNLCRCTGYRKIIDAVMAAADGAAVAAVDADRPTDHA